MVSDVEVLRDFVEIIQNAQSINRMQEFTITLDNLRQTLSGLNPEMKMFNENITKSNVFLSKIAELQESMERQTRSANRFSLVVVGLAVLQVIIAIFL